MPLSPFPTDLVQGYQRFRDGRLESERERYRQLAEIGQKPQTMIIACSDSRASPATIFDCGPGEIFVVRNVANLVPPYQPDGEYHGTSAALEFAVQVLKVANIVVLGHGRCGGIAAVLGGVGEPLSPGDFVGKWTSLAAPALAALEADPVPEEQRQTALERLSVRASLDNLLTFPFISALHEQGRLALHGAWFDIASGELWTMDPQSGVFAQVTG